MTEPVHSLLYHTCVDVTPPPPTDKRAAPDSTLMLGLPTTKLWDVGRTLDFHFLGGTEAQKQNVRQSALEWSKAANLLMRFDVPIEAAEFRVAFNAVGNWSYVGLDNLGIKSPDPTMNIEQDSSALHEVGHALGCIHEHQQPASTIEWNKPVVYQALGGPPNYWDQAKVDFNVFNKYSAAQTQYSAFDPNSIMLYFFPDNWTTNGRGTHANSSLSAVDLAFIRRCYPGCTADFSKPQIATAACKVTVGPSTQFNNYYGNSWLMNLPNQSFIEVRFNQPKQYAGKNIYSRALLRLVHLTSMLYPNPGFSPIDIIVNGTTIKSDYSPPSGNYLTEEWDITANMKDGDNVIRLNFKNARSNYWINKLQVDCVRILD